MEKATKLFEKHWIKATGKPLDETTKHHMKYAIEAIDEALNIADNGFNSSSKYDVTFCPKCKSTDHTMITSQPYKCNDCGHKWQ